MATRFLVLAFWIVLAGATGPDSAMADRASPTEEIAERPVREGEEGPSRSEVGLPVSVGGTGEESRSGAAPGLDALLRLPTGYGRANKPAAVAGTSEADWRRRFESTARSLVDARSNLEKTKAALDGAAVSGGGSQWAVAAPGGLGGGGDSSAPGNSPLSFKLRQNLREHRKSLEDAERAMRELKIQADLAGVPVAWRGNAISRSDQPPPEVGQLLD